MALLKSARKFFLAGYCGQEIDRLESYRFGRPPHKFRQSHGTALRQDSIKSNLSGGFYHGGVYRKTSGTSRSARRNPGPYRARNWRALPRAATRSEERRVGK